MKIVDGFVFKIVTDVAREIFSSGIFQIFILHEDGSEELIESHQDLNIALERGDEIGIEVGQLEVSNEVFKECESCGNENNTSNRYCKNC